ncbi:MAG: hypothetical protein KDJ80_15270 [Nitratireductor sp.]|nr:hypothetical protein [Nitratireductor sp.]
MRMLLSVIILLAGAVPGHAHLGHLGEFAGHSHWVALGAGVAAAALAALIARHKEKQSAQEAAADEADGQEGEAEPAGAEA